MQLYGVKIASLMIAALLVGCRGDGSLSDLFLEGGRDAAKSDYHGAVAIVLVNEDPKYHRLVCSGTMIKPDLLLTAAHCLTIENRAAFNPAFFTGEKIGIFWGNEFQKDELSKTFRIMTIKNAYVHPSWWDQISNEQAGPYHHIDSYSDVAIIRFIETIDPNQVPMAVVNTEAHVEDFPRIRLAGYGLDRKPAWPHGAPPADGSELGDEWLEVQEDAPIKFQAERGKISRVEDYTLQFDAEDNKALLRPGDSGGPVYLAEPSDRKPFREVIAINSYSKVESPGIDTVAFTAAGRLDVANSAEWIAQIVEGEDIPSIDESIQMNRSMKCEFRLSDKKLRLYAPSAKGKTPTPQIPIDLLHGFEVRYMPKKLTLGGEQGKTIKLQRDLFHAKDILFVEENQLVSTTSLMLNFYDIEAYTGAIVAHLYTRDDANKLRLTAIANCPNDLN